MPSRRLRKNRAARRRREWSKEKDKNDIEEQLNKPEYDPGKGDYR